MLRMLVRQVIAAFFLFPAAAHADAVTLSLYFFSSDRSTAYYNYAKPFVDAVNAAGEGIVQIKVRFAQPSDPAQYLHAQQVADGTYDIAFITVGRNRERFPGSSVIEIPRLFRGIGEASHVFMRLIEKHAIKGFDEFHVIAPFVTAQETIHSRTPIHSIKDLKGLTIRANNQTQADVLTQLGAIPVLIQSTAVADAIGSQKINASTFPTNMAVAFGVARVALYHYLLPLGGAPLALIMNRAKFESLPPEAQAIIRQFSGDWMIDRSAAITEQNDLEALNRLKADPRRTVIDPSPSDLETEQAAIAKATEEWLASSPRNRDLLSLTEAEIAHSRGGKQ